MLPRLLSSLSLQPRPTDETLCAGWVRVRVGFTRGSPQLRWRFLEICATGWSLYRFSTSVPEEQRKLVARARYCCSTVCMCSSSGVDDGCEVHMTVLPPRAAAEEGTPDVILCMSACAASASHAASIAPPRCSSVCVWTASPAHAHALACALHVLGVAHAPRVRLPLLTGPIMHAAALRQRVCAYACACPVICLHLPFQLTVCIVRMCADPRSHTHGGVNVTWRHVKAAALECVRVCAETGARTHSVALDALSHTDMEALHTLACFLHVGDTCDATDAASNSSHAWMTSSSRPRAGSASPTRSRALASMMHTYSQPRLHAQSRRRSSSSSSRTHSTLAALARVHTATRASSPSHDDAAAAPASTGSSSGSSSPRIRRRASMGAAHAAVLPRAWSGGALAPPAQNARVVSQSPRIGAVPQLVQTNGAGTHPRLARRASLPVAPHAHVQSVTQSRRSSFLFSAPAIPEDAVASPAPVPAPAATFSLIDVDEVNDGDTASRAASPTGTVNSASRASSPTAGDAGRRKIARMSGVSARILAHSFRRLSTQPSDTISVDMSVDVGADAATEGAAALDVTAAATAPMRGMEDFNVVADEHIHAVRAAAGHTRTVADMTAFLPAVTHSHARLLMRALSSLGAARLSAYMLQAGDGMTQALMEDGHAYMHIHACATAHAAGVCAHSAAINHARAMCGDESGSLSHMHVYAVPARWAPPFHTCIPRVANAAVGPGADAALCVRIMAEDVAWETAKQLVAFKELNRSLQGVISSTPAALGSHSLKLSHSCSQLVVPAAADIQALVQALNGYASVTSRPLPLPAFPAIELSYSLTHVYALTHTPARLVHDAPQLSRRGSVRMFTHSRSSVRGSIFAMSDPRSASADDAALLSAPMLRSHSRTGVPLLSSAPTIVTSSPSHATPTVAMMHVRRLKYERWLQCVCAHIAACSSARMYTWMGALAAPLVRAPASGTAAGGAHVHVSRLCDALLPGDMVLFACSDRYAGVRRALCGSAYDHVAVVCEEAAVSDGHVYIPPARTHTDTRTHSLPPKLRDSVRALPASVTASVTMHVPTLCLLEATNAGVQVFPLQSRVMEYATTHARAIVVRRLLCDEEENGMRGCSDTCVRVRRPGANAAMLSAVTMNARAGCLACEGFQRRRATLSARLARFSRAVTGRKYTLAVARLLSRSTAAMAAWARLRGAATLADVTTAPDYAYVHADDAALDAATSICAAYSCGHLCAAAYMRMGLLPTPDAAAGTRDVGDARAYGPQDWAEGGVCNALLPPRVRLTPGVRVDAHTLPLAATITRTRAARARHDAPAELQLPYGGDVSR